MIVIELIFGIYFIALLILWVGWRRMERKVISKMPAGIPVSILIPFRNEARSLPALLSSLANQNYHGAWEVILINDHSTDSSVAIIQNFIKSNNFDTLVLVDSNNHGKKHALNTGVARAKGEIIVTTDADCTMNPMWLQSMVDAFNNDEVNMVTGPVRIEHETSLWSRMQQLEFAGVIGTSGATLAYNLPTMCNGANLAFRKSAFLKVNGYESNFDIASGDDEFLLKKIRSLSECGIVFNSNRSSVVSTRALSNVCAFVSQRIRWAGKWKFGNDIVTKALALGVFGFHLSVLVVIAMWIMSPTNYSALAILLTVKIIGEFIFLRRVSLWLNNKWSWYSFFAWQLLYPIYSLFIGAASLISGYTWKDRKYPAFTGP